MTLRHIPRGEDPFQQAVPENRTVSTAPQAFVPRDQWRVVGPQDPGLLVVDPRVPIRRPIIEAAEAQVRTTNVDLRTAASGLVAAIPEIRQ